MQKFIVKLPRIAKLLQELYATFVTSYFFFSELHILPYVQSFLQTKNWYPKDPEHPARIFYSKSFSGF